MSANATDAVGVSGVQFKLDGANLGAEVSAAPYVISWNTTLSTDGTHTSSKPLAMRGRLNRSCKGACHESENIVRFDSAGPRRLLLSLHGENQATNILSSQ